MTTIRRPAITTGLVVTAAMRWIPILFASALGLKSASLRWLGFFLGFQLWGTGLNLLYALESMFLLQEGVP
jgi:hypothetical protein